MTMKMKSLLTALLSAVLFVSPVFANAQQAPDVMIQTAVNNLQTKLKKNGAQYKAQPAKYQKLVQEAVVPYFDTRYIAQLVMGRNWRDADEMQRGRFENAFKNMLIRSYADAMLQYYNTVTIDWKPLRLDPAATEVTVNSALLREGKPPIGIGFSMHKANNKWQIYDIVVENISLVDNFRSQVNSEIKRTSIDDVIERMENGSYGGKITTGKSS